MFCTILPDIAINGRDFVLFGDGATIHDSGKTMKEYERYQTTFIKNCVNSPFLNPIENFFSAHKTIFRSMRL